MTDAPTHESVLVNHPYFGSLWLSNVYYKDGYVIGEAWDDSDAGSPYFPDGYMGQSVTMNFPVSCIRKPVTMSFPVSFIRKPVDE